MKKVIAAAALVLMAGLLCGCESLENRVSQQVNLNDDKNYVDYEQLKEDGQLDEDGRYIEPQADSEEFQPYAQIHVTFAQNDFLKCSYFWDEELTDPVDELYCYVNPGQCIYASEPVSENNISKQYTFTGFKVYEYDKSGKRLGALEVDNKDDILVLCIPEDYTGTELSVEPYGVYNPQVLSVADVWYDAAGTANDVGGTWYVNDEVFVEDVDELDAFSSYTVRYKYDKDAYYFIESSVKTSGDVDNGQVEFVQGADGEDGYVVVLHPYTNVILNDRDKNLVSVKVNNKTVAVGEKTIKLDNLRAGDTLSFVCTDGYKITCTADTIDAPKETGDGREYMYTISDDGLKTVSFTVSKLATKNITINVDKNGVVRRTWNTVAQTVTEWFSDGSEEESVLTVSNGKNSYNYEELQNRESISLCETDSLTIKVNKTEGKKVLVSVNGGEEEELTGKMVLSYNEISSLSIRLISEGE